MLHSCLNIKLEADVSDMTNNEKLDEPYAHGKIPSPTGKGFGSTREPIQLGPAEYMVIGDNRLVSEGFIKDRRHIVGKVL